MNLRFPRDIAHTIEHRKLQEILGTRNKAKILFLELWIQLGYAVESSGAAGFLSDKDEFVFRGCEIDQPLRALEASGFIKKVPGGYECALFTAYNAQLDSNYIPDETDASWQLFQNGKKKMSEESSELLEKLPPQSWYTPDGKIEADLLKRAVLLIKIIDAILKTGKRTAAEFEPPLIQAALRVIADWSEARVSVILRRAFEVSRRKNLPPGFTRSTILFLEGWEDICLLLLPSDGFIKWSKRKTHAALTE